MFDIERLIERGLLNEIDEDVAYNYSYSNIKSIDVNRLAEDLYLIEGELEVGIKTYNVSFIYNDETYDLENIKCNCKWLKHDRICAHVGAIIYKLARDSRYYFSVPYHYERDYFSGSDEYYREYINSRRNREKEEMREYSFRSTSHFINDIRQRDTAIIENELSNKSYFLVPELSFDNRKLQLSFRVYDQNKVNYVIKDISDFIFRISYKSYFSYGKKMAFIHDINNFSELSKKYIDYIKEVYSNNNSIDNPKRYIILDNFNLDLFYEYFKDEISLPIREEKMKFSFTLEKYNDDYVLVDDSDLRNIRVTNKNIFKITSGPSIVHISSSLGLNYLIKKGLEDNDVYIRKEDLDEFYRYIIKPIKDEIIFNDNGFLNKEDYLSYDKIEVYGDIIDDSNLEFKVVYKDKENQEVDYKRIDLDDKNAKIVTTLLENASNIKDENYYYLNIDEDKAFSFLNEKIDNLQKYADVYISEDIKKLSKKAKYSISAGIRVKNNLLEVNLSTLDFDIKEIPAILQSYRKRKKFHLLKNGERISLNSDELKDLDELLFAYNIDPKKFKNGNLELETYRALGLDKSLDELSHISVNKDASLKRYIDGFNESKEINTINPKYEDILRDYQKDGVKWLLALDKYQLSGILADEMGLGKTIQVIALLDSIKENRETSIVICPASLIYNWENEINNFNANLNYSLILGNKERRNQLIKEAKNYDLLITSYDYLRRDIEEYQDIDFDYVILDEAQNIKNQKTKNAISTKELNSKHRLALSGTPIENSLAELWSIFDFLMPDYLFTYKYFKDNLESPIVLNNDIAATNKLRELVSPFILRRTKKEVLKELPDKVDHEYLIEFNDEERKLYLANLAQASKEMQESLSGPKVDHIAILAALTRLREICCDPRLLYENIESPSSKVSACIDLIQVLKDNNKKVLVFSSFTSLIDLIQKELDKNLITYYTLTGQTNKELRRKLVADFQSDDTTVFLISLKAGGTGLNLTAAEAVIHIDPWWNISAQNQATDRAHRIGQNANVQVYRMIMKDSIEEKIVKMQQRKKDLADTFTEANDGSLANMSKDEIMELFKR